MYKKILVCLDNSERSTAGVDISLAVAAETGATVTGIHVYAARLHGERFRQMEEGLPERYREPRELERQREVHGELIDRGLRIISDSYMTVLEAKAAPTGVSTLKVHREGKNYDEIARETEEGGYDLVVLGALGLGATESSRIGSVAERVARRARADVLVVRNTDPIPSGPVMAAVDGSPRSFGAVLAAAGLSKVFGLPASAVSAFDPHFHHTAFRSIAGVLTEEAGRLFRFNEQEALHNEIIDRGLERLYRGYLDTAVSIGEPTGAVLSTTLLTGKATEALLSHIKKARPFIVSVGKTGAHSAPGLDIGSVTEHLLREAPSNVLITSREASPAGGRAEEDTGPAWTDGALEILERVPAFVRGMVRALVMEAAEKEGAAEITEEFMRRVRKRMEG